MTGTVVDRPTPPIDRRIRARRIEVRRREGRRRLRRLLAVLGLSSLVLAGWALLRSPALDVDEIVVSGAAQTSEQDVVAALGIEQGDALVDVDAAAAAARVAALPWVFEVAVDRSWAGSISVALVERDPDLVALDAQGSPWWVDADGAVLGAAPPDHGLVAVEGVAPPAPGDVIAAPSAALRIAASLPADVRPLVAAVEVRDGGEIWVRLHARPGEVDAQGAPRSDGGHALIGDGRDLDASLRSLAIVLAQVDLTDLVVVDLRVPANPVVTRTVAAAEPADEEEGGG